MQKKLTMIMHFGNFTLRLSAKLRPNFIIILI